MWAPVVPVTGPIYTYMSKVAGKLRTLSGWLMMWVSEHLGRTLTGLGGQASWLVASSGALLDKAWQNDPIGLVP